LVHFLSSQTNQLDLVAWISKLACAEISAYRDRAICAASKSRVRGHILATDCTPIGKNRPAGV
jgi:hypothetical protein